MKLKKLLTLALPLLLLSSAVVGMAPQPTYQDFVTALNLFRGRQDVTNASKLVGAYNNLNPSNQKRANQAAGPALTQAMSLISPSRQPQVDAEAQRLAQEQAAQAEAQRIAQEQAAQAEAQRLAQEQAAQAEATRLANEKTARDAADAEAKRLAAEKAAKDAADQATRDAADKAAKDVADKAAKDAADKAARDKAAQDAADKAAKDKAEQDAKDKAAKDKADAVAKRLATLEAVIAQIPSMSLNKLKAQIDLILKDQGDEALTRRIASALSDAIRKYGSDKDYADVVKAFNTKIAAIKTYDLSDLQIIVAPVPAKVTLLTTNEIMPALKDNNRFDTEAKAIKHLTVIRDSIEELKKGGPVDPGIIATYNNKLNFLSKSKKFKNLPLPIN